MKITLNIKDRAVVESEISKELKAGLIASFTCFICEYLVTYIKKTFQSKEHQIDFLNEMYKTMRLWVEDDTWDEVEIKREDGSMVRDWTYNHF